MHRGILCLLAASGASLSFTRKGRYIPNLKVAEEIDVSDVTFTTPAPDSTSAAGQKVRTKQRVIVPVVTYHKVLHPSPEVLGPPGDSTVNYEKRNYGVVVPAPDFHGGHKWRRFRYGGKGKESAAHLPGKAAVAGTRYRTVSYPPQRSVRPVYYLVGDDAAVAHQDGDGDPTAYSEDVQLVKPSKKHYPKKYSPGSLKKYNHKTKPADGYKSEGSRSEENESATLENDASQSEERPNKGGDRVEFQMYGMDGPNSYKFGYDTGKGDNRHFRFEERDSEGKIRGHYGYMDNEGKMRIMKYEADPETGFRAGPVDYPSEEAN